MHPATERANLSAFAMYRTVAIHLLRGETDLAGAVLAEMQNRFPPERAQAAYMEMALLFQATYPAGMDATCTAVANFAALNPASVLDPLGSMAFGYGNPDYTAEEMCLGK